jgi:hypothetical protein
MRPRPSSNISKNEAKKPKRKPFQRTGTLRQDEIGEGRTEYPLRIEFTPLVILNDAD